MGHSATAPAQAELSEIQLQVTVDKLTLLNVNGVSKESKTSGTGGTNVAFRASITWDGQRVALGCFDTLPQAALARDLAVLMSDAYRAGTNAPAALPGRTARPNLPVCLNTWEKRESLSDDLGVFKMLLKQRFAHSNAKQQKYTGVYRKGQLGRTWTAVHYNSSKQEHTRIGGYYDTADEAVLAHDQYVVTRHGPDAVTNNRLDEYEQLLGAEGLATIRDRQERFKILQLFDLAPFKTSAEVLLMKHLHHLATPVVTEVTFTEATMDHTDAPSDSTEVATCTRCSRPACAQVKDCFSQQAALACSTHAQEIQKELPGSTLRRLVPVPLSRVPSACECAQALLLHLFTQASSIPDIDSRIKLARSLFSSLSSGEIPKLAVPMTRE